MNTAFLAEVSLCKAGIMLNHCWLTFGAYGTKHAIEQGTLKGFYQQRF